MCVCVRACMHAQACTLLFDRAHTHHAVCKGNRVSRSVFGLQLTRLCALFAFKLPAMPWVWHTFDSLVYSLLPQCLTKLEAIAMVQEVQKKAVEQGETKRGRNGRLYVRVYSEDYCESLPSSRVRKRRRVTQSETTSDRDLLQSQHSSE